MISMYEQDITLQIRFTGKKELTSFRGDTNTTNDVDPTSRAMISKESKLRHDFASGSLLAIFSTSRSLATSPKRSTMRTYNEEIFLKIIRSLIIINYI